ncbi:MAG: rhodanese-like domain-containing protein [Chthoniobacteraceae bacterium]
MKSIAPAELHKLLTAQPGLALIDVRTPVEYAGVHVAQSLNIPLGDLNTGELYKAGKLGKGQPVYLFCHSGGRAQKAAEKFARQGIDDAVVVDGGLVAWGEAGLPLERGAVKVISLERQVRIAAGSLVLTGVLLGYFVSPVFVGLSAFVGAGLVFAGITDFCGMGLLLAKLPWNNSKPA